MDTHSHGRSYGAADWVRALIRLSVMAIAAFPLFAVAEETAHHEQRFSLEFETGAVWQSRNHIQIPDNSAGTRFGLTDIYNAARSPLLTARFPYPCQRRRVC